MKVDSIHVISHGYYPCKDYICTCSIPPPEIGLQHGFPSLCIPVKNVVEIQYFVNSSIQCSKKTIKTI